MAESSTIEDQSKNEAVETAREKEQKLRKGLFRRSFSILGHLFHRTSKEDFEGKLQHLSKEEAAVHSRTKRRSQTWRKLARGVIVYSVIVELLLVGLAVISTRAPELHWQMRALRVLPVFAYPAMATLLYTALARYYRIRERKDQKTLDRLRNERQAKINELKERTNYYRTQQLIQKYDSDPTAKEAAARVLASKLGADAGLKLSSEPSQVDAVDVALAEVMTAGTGHNAAGSTTGLRRRAQQQLNGRSPSLSQQFNEVTSSVSGRADQRMEPDQSLSRFSSGGWVARLAAMLVGEDPNQSYALICGNCRAHNGLSRKEEFPYVTYYCPHCNFLNGPQQITMENVSGGGLEEPCVRDGPLPVNVAATDIASANGGDIGKTNDAKLD